MAKKTTRKLTNRNLTRGGTTPAKVVSSDQLLGDIRLLIEQAREHVASSVNSTMVVLYWNIGKRIREDILLRQRGEYGEQIVATLSQQLREEYGAGFSEPNLSRMMRFAEAFPDERILSTLSKKLSWSHFVELIALDDSLKRDFYAEICRLERWSVRVLRQKIDRLLFERTAVSKKPEERVAVADDFSPAFRFQNEAFAITPSPYRTS